MYTHCTHETVKNKIITQFTKQSPLRVAQLLLGWVLTVQMSDMLSIGVYHEMQKRMCKKVAGLVGMENNRVPP